jgi:hypothetical protein
MTADARPVPSPQLTELLAKALLDEELCDRLFADPESMAREFNLPHQEVQALHLIDRSKFAQAVARLRSD